MKRNLKDIIWDIKGGAYILLALFVGGVMGWNCLMHPLPLRSELAVIEGTIAEVGTATRPSSREDVEFPVIRLNGYVHEFKYLDWFPMPERIEGLHPGEHVRLLSDTNRNHWLWELQRDGQVIISYEEIAATVKHNRRSRPYLAIFLLVLGTGSGLWYLRTLRRERS